MSPQLRRILTIARIAALALGLPLLLWWLAREAALAQVPAGDLALGVGLSLFSMLLYALRLRRVLAVVGIAVGRRETLRLALLSMFYHCFVPFALGADLTKFVKLRARDHATHAIAGAIVLDHAIGATSLTALAAASWSQLAIPGVPLLPLLGGSLVLAALLALVGLLLAARLRPSRDLRGVLAHARRRWPLLAGALALSLTMHALLATAIWVASRDWGLALDFTRVLAVFSASALFQSVPVSVLGVGGAELAGAGLYLALGLPAAAAVLMSSIFYSYRLVMALVGGLWDLWPVRGPEPVGD